MSDSVGLNVNGVLPVRNLTRLLEDSRKEAETRTNQPVVQGLAGYVRTCWESAKRAKRDVEQRMLRNLRQRRGEYEPEVLSAIREQEGSEIFMMLTSNKCRASSAWLRDTLLGARDEKCWSIEPSPLPDLPEHIKQSVVQEAVQEAMTWFSAGNSMSREMMFELVQTIKDRQVAELREMSQRMCERMELKMEDQLVEGGFLKAFKAFIDDYTTFPSAIIKGPVMRNKRRLSWNRSADGAVSPEVTDEIVEEWDRIDPMMAYPSPTSTNPDDGFFIEHHRLTRSDLLELKGVDGYDDDAITAVLDDYGRGGLREWLSIDSEKADAEGRSQFALETSPDATIDAIQFWGSVQGKMLKDWGLKEVENVTDEYHCEVWLIGQWVIKATLNYDPLRRKPYFKASYEEIPGAFWGNAIPDLIRDCQTMCNAAARALADNMAIASGPQVVFNVDRLPDGEDLTQMYPWKVWQVTSDPYSGSARPMDFYQPNLLSNDLLQIYTHFSNQADEFSMFPRYMSGNNAGVGGAGRTASGMSMLMGNASKTVKQAVANIDGCITEPLIERLYVHNMLYVDDPDLKGDVSVHALGANSLVVKDAAQVRRNEFLQIALANPLAQEVVGKEGVAALLHEQAKTLDLDADEIVPPPEVLRMRWAAQAQMAPMNPAQANPTQPKQPLMTGEPATDNFSPVGMVA